MEHSLRAYVVLTEVQDLSPSRETTAPMRFKLVFKNTGRTPAVDVVIECFICVNVSPKAEIPPAYAAEGPTNEMRGVIGRDQTAEIDISLDKTFLKTHEFAISHGAKYLQVQGKLTYRDVITGSDRETNFNWVSSVNKGRKFVPEDEIGNSIT